MLVSELKGTIQKILLLSLNCRLSGITKVSSNSEYIYEILLSAYKRVIESPNAREIAHYKSNVVEVHSTPTSLLQAYQIIPVRVCEGDLICCWHK